MKCAVIVALCVVLLVGKAYSWDQRELDLFDLVEEIEQNFYEVLGVNETASAGEIKRAFRHLSLKLHPDKSDDPNATEKFRQLVAVAEVLKDEQLREWYDQILVEGLPDWRQPLYYYRRVRKMGLFEMSILVLFIATVGHYLYGWAAYLEKQLVLNELLSRKQKRERKTKKSTRGVSQQLEAELQYHTEQANASIPSLRNLLPIALVKSFISLTKLSLHKLNQWKAERAHRQKQQQEAREKEEAEKSTEDDEAQPVKRKPRKNGYSQRAPSEEQPDSSPSPVPINEQSTSTSSTGLDNIKLDDRTSTVDSSADEDLNGGCGGFDSGSYENELEAIMADIDDDNGSRNKTRKKNVVKFERKVEQVKLYKGRDEESERLKAENESQNESHDRPSSTEEKNARSPLSEVCGNGGMWSQYQQSQLEWALAHYPKFTKDRWDNISKAVPGKSTEECIGRCKELYDAVRKRRSQKSTHS